MEPQKISFGFSKLSKKNHILSNNVKQDDKHIELIECLEGQSIKVKDAIVIVDEPLVIPLKDGQKNLLDRIRAAKKRQQDLESKEPEDNRPDSELTPDELAARQLIREARERLANGHSKADNTKIAIIPLKADISAYDDKEESTIEDYESVPISDFGLALLRGMNWKEGTAIGKQNSSKPVIMKELKVRPKGVGLGATQIIQSNVPTKKATDKDGTELALVKGAFAKVIAGPHKGNYCEILGFDEEAGRVIMKMYPTGEVININELMLVPVTKEEFSKGYKILNNAKYEEYKKESDKKLENYRIKSELPDRKHIKQEYNSDSEAVRSSKSKEFVEKTKNHESRGSERDFCSADDRPSKNRSNGRSKNSRHRQEDSSDSLLSSDEEEERYRDKKSKKHSKSKNRDRSISKERHKKSKKHSNKYHDDSSESDYDHKKEKRKKNKCKSRHRRNSSSSGEDRRYRSRR